MNNVKIYLLGDPDITRKEKKSIKTEVKKLMMVIYKEKKPIKDLKTISVVPKEQNRYSTKERFIYSETEISREAINALFPNKIIKYTNYLLGKAQINAKNILYLMDIDDLFFMADEYHIWPSNNKKNMYVTIH